MASRSGRPARRWRRRSRDRTGHVFRDFALLQRALTHSSARRQGLRTTSGSNSSATGCSAWSSPRCCSTAFPDATRGRAVACGCNALVMRRDLRRDRRARSASTPLIRADARRRGRPRRKARNVRADAVEALIAAIYLDGGLEAARAFILRYWEPRSQAVGRGAARRQDRAAGMGARRQRRRAPAYAIEDRDGPDHDPLFTVSVDGRGLRSRRPARGRSKREAEQAAAAALLRREGVWTDEGNDDVTEDRTTPAGTRRPVPASSR